MQQALQEGGHSHEAGGTAHRAVERGLHVIRRQARLRGDPSGALGGVESAQRRVTLQPLALQPAAGLRD
jgi:hypothetical protein